MLIAFIIIVAYGIWMFSTSEKPTEGQKQVVRAFQVGHNEDELCNGAELKVETRNGEGIRVSLFSKQDLVTKDGTPVKGFTLFCAERVVRKRAK